MAALTDKELSHLVNKIRALARWTRAWKPQRWRTRGKSNYYWRLNGLKRVFKEPRLSKTNRLKTRANDSGWHGHHHEAATEKVAINNREKSDSSAIISATSKSSLEFSTRSKKPLLYQGWREKLPPHHFRQTKKATSWNVLSFMINDLANLEQELMLRW